MPEQQNTDSSIVTTELMSTVQIQPATTFPILYKQSLFLIFLGFYFLAFAITELITDYSEKSYKIPMVCTDYQCIGNTGPINFVHNNSKIYFYLLNPSIAQNDISTVLQQQNDDISTCSSYQLNSDGQKNIGIQQNSLNQSQKQFPCGMFVSYFPGEAFKVRNQQNSAELLVQTTDLDVLNIEYKNQQSQKQWTDVTSQRFKVWNEKQISCGTKKLWGTATGFSSGSLIITITSINKIHEKFAFNLSIVVTDNEAYFGYNLQWCIFNFIFSLSIFVMGCVSFWCKQQRENKIDLQNEQEFQMTPGFFKNSLNIGRPFNQ